MAQVIKKATVPESILGLLDWETEGYLIRYRIVAENKNIRSHWSPIYLISSPDFLIVDGSYSETLGQDNKTIGSVVWGDANGRPSYDVFVSFYSNSLLYSANENPFLYDGSYYFYHGTTQTHNYSFIVPDDSEFINIIVQPASNKKLIKDSLIIFSYYSEPMAS